MTRTDTSIRDRLMDAAHRIIERSGWSDVTMSAVGAAVGVSRQTVYNEFGSKHGLAEHLAMRELQTFLDVVRRRLADESDIVQGIRSACEGVLLMGEVSVIVRAIASSGPRTFPHGPSMDNDFLKILTTESGQLVEAAVTIVQEAVRENYPPTGLTEPELAVAVEAVVRLVLSGITRPSKPPAQAADDIAWIISLVLEGAAVRS